MKFLIGRLLLSFVIFLQFGELNASGKEEASSSADVRKPKFFHAPVNCPQTQGPPHEIIQYGNCLIKLWLNVQRSRVLHADFDGSYIPPSGFYTNNNFYIRLIHVGRFQVVGYLKPNWELFGVRAQNRRAQPIVLEPTPTKWYIIHEGYKYKVTQTPAGKVQAVNLFPKNMQNQFKVTTRTVTAGGIEFIVYIAPDSKVVGAIYRMPCSETELHSD